MRAGRRIPELDALRGIAAAVVLTFHWLAVMPAWNADTRHDGGAYLLLNAVKYTPLHVFAAGPEAVLLFFVLSGFVLALPFVEGRAGGYLPFLVRRAFRIYPAAWLMAAVSALALLRVGAGAVVSGPSMVDAGWLYLPDAKVVLGHIGLLGVFNSRTLSPPLWSLVVELRVSVIFPVLVAVAVAIGVWRACALAGVAGLLISLKLTPWDQTTIGFTASHVFCFVVGIALAHRGRVPRGRWPWVTALLLFTAPYTLAWLAPSAAAERAITLIPPTIGAGLLLVLCRRGRARALLLRPVPQFLGEISYSLYLWHFFFILALPRLMPGVAPIALAPAGIALAVGISVLSRRWVEVPLTRAGARLAARLEADRARPALARS